MSKMYNLYRYTILRTRQGTAKHSVISLCGLYVLDTVAVSFLLGRGTYKINIIYVHRRIALMKQKISSHNTEIPLNAQKSLQCITIFGLIVGALLSSITLGLFLYGEIMHAIHHMSIYKIYYVLFSFFFAIPVGLLVSLIVGLRVWAIKRRFKLDNLRKSYPLNMVGIMLCLFPSVLMAALLLIDLISLA